MSRIFIENLPKNITENEIVNKFSEKGEITDVKLRKSKRNAFVGFKLPEQAQDACEYFNKTFINSSRISVKIADTVRAYQSNTIQNVKKVKKKFDPFDELKDDPEFQDFLKLQRNTDSSKNQRIWDDDALLGNQVQISKSIDNEEKENKAEEDLDTENKANLRCKKSFEFTVKIQGLPYKIKKSQLKDFLKPIRPLSMRFVPNVKGIAYVSFRNSNDLNAAMIKHRGFLNGHRIEIKRFKDSNKNAGKESISSKCGSSDTKKFESKNGEIPEPIIESGRIYVRNLSYTCTEDDLRVLFEKFGVLTEVHLPIDVNTKKPKGFAFITFMFPEHAVKAYNEIDKTDFQGRLIHLLPAYHKIESKYAANRNSDPNINHSAKSSYKQTKIEENKESDCATRWNTLFVRPNAVADIMAKNLQQNKLDLLTSNDSKTNVAVRMALGETQIVNEIKQFLIDNGVDLHTFERSNSDQSERSKTTILVKNLEAGTEESEIKQLFERFGLVKKVLLPPHGITAIVEMQEPNEAKFAFKKLSYQNFKHHPIYLEWAPQNIFTQETVEDQKSMRQEDFNLEARIDDRCDSNDQEDLDPDATVYVKNLNFETTESDFRKHFEQIGRIYSATIAKKKTSKGILSMGYGFIQFYRRNDAKKSIIELQNSYLDQHKIEIKLSNRSIVENKSVVKKKNFPPQTNLKQTGSKICVKNIPFEATINDITKIFNVYGKIKSVRIPRKLSGSSKFRGFGFVDFVTKEDAKRAFDSLSSSTHLYGRPLVLEWARDDSLDDGSESSLNFASVLDSDAQRIGSKTARYFSFQNDSTNNTG
ncbi:RNA-binding protein 19-like protein [Sarcoptes scabiei]|uniref:RNA-binding protein 19-like protein n=1 Tax=Sarcoptes scabiei TaxID=52283 RepID=A0A132A2G9_SARSC|nr:RNA-binding protein 19-like protein [Sarcoptes scabiei]